VEDLEEDERAVMVERVEAQWKGEAVGWSSLAEEEVLHAPPGTTDEEVMQHLDANYDPEARAKLQVIGLDNTQVTDAAVTVLAKGCPDLELIGLYNTQVTDAAATALAKGCPGLQFIGLYNTQVTDAAATALAKGCPGLQYIWLDSTQVTDAAATTLTNACPGLQTIDLRNTQVTPSLAKVWRSDATAEHKQHPFYGGTIKDFRWELNRITKKTRSSGTTTPPPRTSCAATTAAPSPTSASSCAV
jgi:hypothetical protein